MSIPGEMMGRIGRTGNGPVLCVGDVMLDRFVDGDVERISPEGPIPVFRISGERCMLGGAGNVVRNLAALGAETRFAGVVGDDETGREILRLLVDEEAVVPDIVVVGGRDTTIKTRFVAAGQQMLRADRETVASIAPDTARRLCSAALAHLPECAAVLFSDYGKGVLGRRLIAEITEAAGALGKPVIVDPKGSDYSIYRGADLATPNRRELSEATRMAVGDEEGIVAAAQVLRRDTDIAAILVTRGAEGMTLVDADGTRHFPAEAREVFDVSGAGDTVAAALAVGLSCGMDMADAARLANAAAGVVVAKAGTATVTYGELMQALHRIDLLAGTGKILGRDAAAARTASWRRRGFRVGFANGCFDLLHPGHVALLAQARAACDRLVVAVNTDASVSRLKGPRRPVHTLEARQTVLASLATVDMVVPFGEDTPLALIRELLPDVLVKGADHAPDTVVGADLVTGRGGRLLIADHIDGHSTTATVARIADGERRHPSG